MEAWSSNRKLLIVGICVVFVLVAVVASNTKYLDSIIAFRSAADGHLSKIGNKAAAGQHTVESRGVEGVLGVLGVATTAAKEITRKSLYNVRTESDLLSSSAMAPSELQYDAEKLLDWAVSLCALDINNYYYRHAPSNSDSAKNEVESLRLVNLFSRTFCVSGVGNGALVSARDIMRERIAGNGLNAAIEFAKMVDADSSLEDRSFAQVALLDIVKSTESPALFQDAAELLSDGSLGDWQPNGFEWKYKDSEFRRGAAILGSIIARCQLFSDCGPGTLMSIRYCLPLDCRFGKSITDHLSYQVSPVMREDAEAYANALLAQVRGH
ncbi:MAG: hypothetical protein CVV12_14160 [Gammaproteobacteria bacterium HGW-Gammaproteobacteria-2]|jgi:hypothetical protein|nr:MAG: hypothetical protein CVV12_14160 [Gammaproteobacteria bacterium HGW-Gammaproteobacteria-2]